MHDQLTMTGEDWLSDRDVKTRKRLEAARAKAGQRAAAALEKAADALAEFSMACTDCNDASSPRREDDGRTIMQRNLREYQGWLESVYGSR